MSKPIPPPCLKKNKKNYWIIRYHDGNRMREKSTGQLDDRAAEMKFSTWLSRQDLPNQNNPTVRNVMDYYLTNYVEDHVIDQPRARMCAKRIISGFGNYRVNQLHSDVIRRYKNNRTGNMGVTESTVRRELVTLVAALNFNADEKKLNIRLVPKIILPRDSEPRDLWLTEGEEVQFISEASKTSQNTRRYSRIHRFVYIATQAPARRAAIETLPWLWVDLENRVINYQMDDAARKCKRKVAVPINEFLWSFLSSCKEQATSEYVLDHPGSIQREFEALRNRCVALYGEKFAKVSSHTLRHTWATHAARRGVSLWDIAGVLANSVAVVTRTYAHHCPKHLMDAVSYREKKTAPDG